jgi:hypothetical protein
LHHIVRHADERPVYIAWALCSTGGHDAGVRSASARRLCAAEFLWDDEAKQEATSVGSLCAAGVIWTMKFSKNGKYLASAGQDAAVRVWEVCLRRGDPSPGRGDPPDQQQQAAAPAPAGQLPGSLHRPSAAAANGDAGAGPLWMVPGGKSLCSREGLHVYGGLPHACHSAAAMCLVGILKP